MHGEVTFHSPGRRSGVCGQHFATLILSCPSCCNSPLTKVTDRRKGLPPPGVVRPTVAQVFPLVAQAR